MHLLAAGHAPSSLRRRRGFTLVEIMIVVVIIGLLAAVAVPALKQSRVKSAATRTANDLKKVGDAFSAMIFENSGMPTGIYNQDANGTVPAGFLTADLPAVIYSRPLGPNSTISFDLRTSLAAANEGVVVLTSLAGDMDPDVMLKIDQIMDDGNLSTGEVRRANAIQLIYKAYSQ